MKVSEAEAKIAEKGLTVTPGYNYYRIPDSHFDLYGVFYDKLLLLKDLMNTDTGRKLAASRHAFLETYLRRLEEELGPEEENRRG